MNYIVVAVLVILSGIFSGLTIGLFSLDLTELKRKVKLKSKEAQKVYSIRKNGNLLLCTLLLGNVAVNSTMAIFLGSIATGVIAGFVSTGLIVIFGEILPIALFSRYALKFAAQTVWLVRFFIVIFYPISKPISFFLDKLLGEELGTIWSKREIEEIIKYHEDSPDSTIDEDEERIILGALSFSEKVAEDIMTPSTVIFALEESSIIDSLAIKDIKDKGFSRIPVYKDTIDNIVGILHTKELIGYDLDHPQTALTLSETDNLNFIVLNKKLDSLLDIFLKSKKHIAFVYNEHGSLKGIVTLEDVIEEILKVEIIDEGDSFEDMQKHAKELFKKKKTRRLNYSVGPSENSNPKN